MPYRVTRDEHGRPHLDLVDEPPYCHALDAGAALPRTGEWLVLVFAVWSAPDQAAVGVALEVARGLGGAVRLGIRPFDDPDELGEWQPAGASPYWLLLSDGAVTWTRNGTVTAGELADQIHSARRA